MAEEEMSEDEKASRREDRVWGCGADALGCGCDVLILVTALPVAVAVFLR
jgi:hypothetical protein